MNFFLMKTNKLYVSFYVVTFFAQVFYVSVFYFYYAFDIQFKYDNT